MGLALARAGAPDALLGDGSSSPSARRAARTRATGLRRARALARPRREAVEARPQGRSIRRDLATGLVEQVFDWDLGGSQRFVDIDLETSDTSHTVYSIREGDPLSAEVRFHATSGMARGDWSMRSEVTSAMTSDAEAFHVTTMLEVYERDARIFARTWTHRFPRDRV